MNDPGWGSYVDPSDGGGNGKGGGKQGGGGGGKNLFDRFGKVPVLIGGGIVLLLVVGIVYTQFAKSDKKATTTTAETRTTPTTTEDTTTEETTTEETTTEETTPTEPATTPTVSTLPAGTIAKADYIQQADAICTKYKPQITQIGQSGTVDQLVPVVTQELAELRTLPMPDQDAEVISQALTIEQEALNLLASGDTQNANAKIVQGDTLAGQFGLTVCNYGY